MERIAFFSDCNQKRNYFVFIASQKMINYEKSSLNTINHSAFCEQWYCTMSNFVL